MQTYTDPNDPIPMEQEPEPIIGWELAELLEDLWQPINIPAQYE